LEYPRVGAKSTIIFSSPEIYVCEGPEEEFWRLLGESWELLDGLEEVSESQTVLDRAWRGS